MVPQLVLLWETTLGGRWEPQLAERWEITWAELLVTRLGEQ